MAVDPIAKFAAALEQVQRENLALKKNIDAQAESLETIVASYQTMLAERCRMAELFEQRCKAIDEIVEQFRVAKV